MRSLVNAAADVANPGQENGTITSPLGRVLKVCALGKTVSEAQVRAYRAVDRIDWPEGFCRRDIGWQAVAREKGGLG